MGEKNEPGEEDGIIGRIGPERVAENPSSFENDRRALEEGGQDNRAKESGLEAGVLGEINTRAEERNRRLDRERRSLPGALVAEQARIFIKRLQGAPNLSKSAQYLRIQLNLVADPLPELYKRFEGTDESDWQKKPTYYRAVLLEIDAKKP